MTIERFPKITPPYKKTPRPDLIAGGRADTATRGLTISMRKVYHSNKGGVGMQEKIKQMPLRMPLSLHKRIGHEAIERGTSLTRCILNLLDERLAELEDCHKSVPIDQHVQKES
jgi:hypothetical protein